MPPLGSGASSEASPRTRWLLDWRCDASPVLVVVVGGECAGGALFFFELFALLFAGGRTLGGCTLSGCHFRGVEASKHEIFLFLDVADRVEHGAG